MTCEATTRTGAPCRAPPLRGSPYCFWHDPKMGKARARARKKGGVAAHGLDPNAPPPTVVISSVTDVLGILEVAASDILFQKRSLDRARALIYLAGAALKCLETGEIEERLAALEAGITP